MPPTVKYPLPSGRVVEVEIDSAIQPSGYVQASGASRVLDGVLDVSNAIEPVADLVDVILGKFMSRSPTPPSVEISIGLKFGIEGTVIVAKGTAEANLNIKLRYGSGE